MRLVVLFFFSILSSLCFSQDEQKPSFPAAWEGVWVGNLEIFLDTGMVQTLPMELHILPIDNSENYSWTIIYGEDKEVGRRAYELQTLDAAKGQFIIDEKNSIKIEGYFLGNKFIQRFIVSEAAILLTVEKTEVGSLIWEIISGSTKHVSSTGGEVIKEEEIPIVKSYPLTNLQRAILKKQ